jgi:hypothetical protein
MWSILGEATFPRFDEAQAAALRVAAQGHCMQWMTWGNPPRCVKAGCIQCGRELAIVRTRQGRYRLEGAALQGCVPPHYVPLQLESPQRKVA